MMVVWTPGVGGRRAGAPGVRFGISGESPGCCGTTRIGFSGKGQSGGSGPPGFAGAGFSSTGADAALGVTVFFCAAGGVAAAGSPFSPAGRTTMGFSGNGGLAGG